MRIDKNIIEAIKTIGHDRIIVHDGSVYSCKITDEQKFGEKGAKMNNVAIVHGAKSIIKLGDLYITAPYAMVDLKNE